MMMIGGRLGWLWPWVDGDGDVRRCVNAWGLDDE